MKKCKYQFGGGDSTGFFNQMADSYMQQMQQSVPEDEYVPQEDQYEPEESTDDYDALQSDYADLQAQYDELASRPQLPTEQKSFDDQFLNFMFTPSKSKRPIDFDELDSPRGSVGYKPGVSGDGLSARTQGILGGLSEVIPDLTITSGRRSQEQNQRAGGAANSFHLTGDAVDLRPTPGLSSYLTSAAGRNYIASQGYEIIDERSRAGHGAHWHLEPAKRQYGGSSKYAFTPHEQRMGLNDPAYDEMHFPMQGSNTFRGLDNGQPVYLTDETGNEQVLYGPHDTVQMHGSVHEKKMQMGGNVMIPFMLKRQGERERQKREAEHKAPLPSYGDKESEELLRRSSMTGTMLTRQGDTLQHNQLDTVQYLALRQLLNSVGSPKIRYDENTWRSHYNAVNNSMTLKYILPGRGPNDLVEEASHAYQANVLKQRLIDRGVGDWLNSPYLTVDGYNKQYDRKGTLENEAHEEIAPKLYKYVDSVYEARYNSQYNGEPWKYQFGGTAK